MKARGRFMLQALFAKRRRRRMRGNLIPLGRRSDVSSFVFFPLFKFPSIYQVAESLSAGLARAKKKTERAGGKMFTR